MNKKANGAVERRLRPGGQVQYQLLPSLVNWWILGVRGVVRFVVKNSVGDESNQRLAVQCMCECNDTMEIQVDRHLLSDRRL